MKKRIMPYLLIGAFVINSVAIAAHADQNETSALNTYQGLLESDKGEQRALGAAAVITEGVLNELEKIFGLNKKKLGKNISFTTTPGIQGERSKPASGNRDVISPGAQPALQPLAATAI